jgi:beta-glucosidase-like glycosyl hydrolase
LFFPTIFGVSLAEEPKINGKEIPKASREVLTDDIKKRLFENSYKGLQSLKKIIENNEKLLESEKDEQKKQRLRETIDFQKQKLIKERLDHSQLEKKWPQIAKDFYESEVKRLQSELEDTKKQLEGMK